MVPIQWKTGLIYCLLHRAYVICSSWKLFHDEIYKLSNICNLNGYTKNFFYKCVNNFVNNKLTCNTSSKSEHKHIISIPYIGNSSVIFKKQLCKLFKSYYNINCTIVFNSFKVQSYFSLKCKTPKPLRANVVYQFNCLNDSNLSYIGKTKRHFITRIQEHKKSSSSIKDHLLFCDTCNINYNCDNFKVVDTGNSNFNTTILEALYIKHKLPTLNNTLTDKGDSFFLDIF